MQNDPQLESGNTRSNFALESFKNVQELIRFIDQKAGAILVVYGLILTVFIEVTKNMKFVDVSEIKDPIDVGISVLVLVVGSFFIYLLVQQLRFIILQILRPRLAMNYRDDEHSIFYFEHIAEIRKNDLINKFKTTTEENMIEEIVGQLYEVSKIMKIKTHRLQKAMESLFVIIVILLLFIFLTTLV